jgi:hypothetical protein
MTSSQHPVRRFRSEIRRLIEEIEACIHARQPDGDREYRFQAEAFQERCGQAEQLTEQLDTGKDDDSGWSRRDGDAYRIQESLQLSLDYFRGDRDH